MLADLLNTLYKVTELEQVTVLHLRQCVQHLLTAPAEAEGSHRHPVGPTLSVSAVVTYMRPWRVFFNWCYKEELIEKNPVTRLENPKAPKKVKPSFSDEQAQRMFDSFDLSTEVGFRDYVILCLLLDTGLRRSEVVELRVQDVHDTYIKVHGKGDKERKVGIHPELGMLLWKYINKYRHPRTSEIDALFLAAGAQHAGLPLTRGGLLALMQRLKRVTGIDDVRLSAHTFRHTFARMYLDAGGDVFSLSREMGHTDIKTTQGYLEDFKSDNAVKHHNSFSPLSRFKVRKQRKGSDRVSRRGGGKQNRSRNEGL
jgi:integrase/recombinase XerD